MSSLEIFLSVLAVIFVAQLIGLVFVNEFFERLKETNTLLHQIWVRQLDLRL